MLTKTAAKKTRRSSEAALLVAAIRQLEQEYPSHSVPCRKRKGKSTALHHRVSVDLLLDLQTLARKLDLTTSELTRRILEQFVTSITLVEKTK